MPASQQCLEKKLNFFFPCKIFYRNLSFLFSRSYKCLRLQLWSFHRFGMKRGRRQIRKSGGEKSRKFERGWSVFQWMCVHHLLQCKKLPNESRAGFIWQGRLDHPWSQPNVRKGPDDMDSKLPCWGVSTLSKKSVQEFYLPAVLVTYYISQQNQKLMSSSYNWLYQSNSQRIAPYFDNLKAIFYFRI